MNIFILGNGGAINSGLHYNSFIINNEDLCELPPDIMYILNDNNVDILKIKSIFISYLHGDHTFGFPFLVLNLFFNRSDTRIDLFGSPNIKDHFNQLVINAFTTAHPCLDWMQKQINFIEIDEKCGHSLIDPYQVKYFPLEHPVETYGFTLYKRNSAIFLYIADTLWNKNVENMLKEKPKAVIIDLNGGKE